MLNKKDCFKSSEHKKLYNKILFKVVAPKYNLITKVLSFGRDYSWKKLLVNKLVSILIKTNKIQNISNCLDIACGTGDITLLLANKLASISNLNNKNINITGIDLTTEMLDLAKKNNQNKSIMFKCQDMCNLEVSDSSIDTVTGGYALRNAPDLKKALNEIYRVLKPGGLAAFLDFCKPSNRVAQKAQYYALKFWGSLWGLVFHKDAQVYGYIAESLDKFPDRSSFKKILQDSGFMPVTSKLCFFGFTEITIVKKVK